MKPPQIKGSSNNTTTNYQACLIFAFSSLKRINPLRWKKRNIWNLVFWTCPLLIKKSGMDLGENSVGCGSPSTKDTQLHVFLFSSVFKTCNLNMPNILILFKCTSFCLFTSVHTFARSAFSRPEVHAAALCFSSFAALHRRHWRVLARVSLTSIRLHSESHNYQMTEVGNNHFLSPPESSDWNEGNPCYCKESVFQFC